MAFWGWIILSNFLFLNICRADLIVVTSYGLVKGFQYEWKSNPALKFKAWKGIPFASPPVGDLRWRAPIRPQKWDGILPCLINKPSCIQPSGSGSEDCLYLNVYANVNTTNSGPFPVLFYIYGGALMSGSATDDFSGFIAHAGNGNGIIVVTVSYRLNIFGFFASKELSLEQGGHSGNYGILDQLAALEWVRDNIRNFGGDPRKVTIAGQSSGGTSVFALMSTSLSKGLFQAAISLSGSPNITISMSAAEAQNAEIVSASGCEDMDCLRAKDPSFLVNLIPRSWSTPGKVCCLHSPWRLLPEMFLGQVFGACRRDRAVRVGRDL